MRALPARPASDSASAFPADYVSSRARFREAAGVVLSQYPRAKLDTQRVPSAIDPDLTIDSLYIPAARHPRRLVVITTGVHGPEAFAGSVALDVFFREKLKNIDLNETSVLLFHALNPYGFKYGTRVDEKSIDLNRNFGMGNGILSAPNPAYQKLAKVLEPGGKNGGWFWTTVGLFFTLLWRIITFQTSSSDIESALANGQYTNPKGLYYGGQDFEPQVDCFRRVAGPIIAAHKRVLHLDVHTGVGHQNQLQIMPGRRFTPRDNTLMQTIFDSKKDGSAYEIVDAETNPQFFTPNGDIIDLSHDLRRPGARGLSVTLEFGTNGDDIFNLVDSLGRVVSENQGRHFGYSSKEAGRDVRRRFVDLFYPTAPDWRRAIVEKTRHALGPCLDRFLAN